MKEENLLEELYKIFEENDQLRCKKVFPSLMLTLPNQNVYHFSFHGETLRVVSPCTGAHHFIFENQKWMCHQVSLGDFLEKELSDYDLRGLPC